jgi:peptide/nickel transport system permease protein
VARFGNWEQVSAHYHQLLDAYDIASAYQPSEEEAEDHALYRSELLTLRHTADLGLRAEFMASLDTLAPKFQASPNQILDSWKKVRTTWNEVEQQSTPWKKYVPTLHFYGLKCQYHRWLVRLLKLDFGRSFQDDKPVLTRIGEALRWTLFISIFVVIVVYAGSIRLGTFAAVHRNSKRERVLSILLFILHSLPSFWVATLLINFLATPDYLKLFPAGGVMSDGNSSMSLGAQLLDYAWHLILPTLCYIYGAFTVLSRQMRAGMLDVLESDYIRTARAKGLPERKVVMRHALRNSLIPLITTFAGVFPALVGGSVIIERIFGIPGMGREILTAIMQHDYPVIIGVFTLTALLTLFGILVSDVLYAIADPRISYQRK